VKPSAPAKKERVAAEDDLEEVAVMLTLRDPLMAGRIEIPAKSTACDHLPAFDLRVCF
jgi:hypothetical protein